MSDVLSCGAPCLFVCSPMTVNGATALLLCREHLEGQSHPTPEASQHSGSGARCGSKVKPSPRHPASPPPSVGAWEGGSLPEAREDPEQVWCKGPDP